MKGMKRERFDFVLGVGSSCIASQALRDAGLQYASYPFDWMSGPTFAQRIRTICSDFRDWFRAEDFEFKGNPNGFTHDLYRNRATGGMYPHDFDPGRPFAECYSAVKEKYDRRIARLYASIRRSKHVLVVWLENPLYDDRPADEEVLDAYRSLVAKFPAVDIRVLIIDRAMDDMSNGDLEPHEYGWRVACGYRRKTVPGKDARPWDLEVGPIVAALKHFRARDFRTAAERKAHRQAERRKQFATVGARSWPAYLLVRLQLKLCHHLRKRLLRRGIELEEVRRG